MFVYSCAYYFPTVVKYGFRSYRNVTGKNLFSWHCNSYTDLLDWEFCSVCMLQNKTSNFHRIYVFFSSLFIIWPVHVLFYIVAWNLHASYGGERFACKHHMSANWMTCVGNISKSLHNSVWVWQNERRNTEDGLRKCCVWVFFQWKISTCMIPCEGVLSYTFLRMFLFFSSEPLQWVQLKIATILAITTRRICHFNWHYWSIFINKLCFVNQCEQHIKARSNLVDQLFILLSCFFFGEVVCKVEDDKVHLLLS